MIDYDTHCAMCFDLKGTPAGTCWCECHDDYRRDSAETVIGATGSARKKESGVALYSFIPIGGVRRAAMAAAEGERKYSDKNYYRNQDKPIPTAESLEHAMRHIESYRAGNRDEDHLGHAIWDLMVLADVEMFYPAGHNIPFPILGKTFRADE